MKQALQLMIAFSLMCCVLVGCADYEKLESIEISPVVADNGDDSANDLYVCNAKETGGNGFRQFKVTGHYSDDSTENLTADSKWTTDASDDSYVSDTIPGTVYCTKAYGVIGILATYSEDASESDSTDTDSSVDFTDSVLVNAK